MKKLRILIAILLATSTASLGQGIGNTTPSDTSIILPKQVAKQVAKDVIRVDSLKAELSKTSEILMVERLSSRAKDSLIGNLNQQIGIYKAKELTWQEIADNKDNMLDLEQQVSKKLARDLKVVRRKKTFTEIIGGAIIIGLSYMYITK